MNFMFQSMPWWSLVTLVAVPPLIFLLYFLKLRRTPLKVPSTYLWSKTIEDMHVNSFWQRLRKNLLLLLQLLFALMLLLTCLRPGCDGTELAGERFIFLIDNSASMAATDSPGKISRLQSAKNEIQNLIQAMPAGASAMLISFSDSANVHQSYTSNKSELIRKLGEIQQTQRTSDLNEALAAATGLANPGRSSDKASQIDVQVAEALDAVLHIYSDGGVGKVPQFAPGSLQPVYHAVGSVDDPPKNVGITAFSIGEPSETDGAVQLFGRLQNSDDKDQSVNVSFFLGDILQDALAKVLVPAGGTKGISFELPADVAEVNRPTKVRLVIEDDDVFSLDNEAFAVLNPPRKSNVIIVSQNMSYFRYALSTDAIKRRFNVEFRGHQYLRDPQYLERSLAGFYDLAIFDSVVPETMPQCNTVMWNAVPPGKRWQRSEPHSPTPVLDFDSSHPLLASVRMGSITILDSRNLEGPPGSLSLIESTSGTIAMLGPRDGFLDFVLGFAIIETDGNGTTTVNSDWPKKLSFPVFMQNVVQELGGDTFFEISNIRTGELIAVKTLSQCDEITVRSPEGDLKTLAPQPNRQFVYNDAQTVGIYEVTAVGNQNVDQLIAVNLTDANESNLVVRDDLELGYTDLERVATQVKKRKEFWPFLLLTALMLLMTEWVIYNRRVFI
jgi:hypothetical protein